MRIVIIEPYLTGSHRQWAENLKRYSSHNIQILGLPGRWWKWRMQGGCLELGHRFRTKVRKRPDLIIASDMLDLPAFILTAGIRDIPIVIYFHENQITYPWKKTDRDIKASRFRTYGMINIKSALSANRCLFNSRYHMDSFLEAIPFFISHFPDERPEWINEELASKSRVLHLGLSLSEIKAKKNKKSPSTTILWNHRWEYDKNPGDFFEALRRTSHLDYRINIVGKNFRNSPKEFEEARGRFQDRISHWGFQEKRDGYINTLSGSDILPVTTNQDFFGISTAEAVYAGVHPILPKRLAYPEIYRIDENPDLFYDNMDQLVNQLTHLIENPGSRRDVSHLVAPFDWRNIISTYDKLFEEIADSH